MQDVIFAFMREKGDQLASFEDKSQIKKSDS